MPRSIKTALLVPAALGAMCLAAPPARPAAPSERVQETEFRLLWSGDQGPDPAFAVEVTKGYATLFEQHGDEPVRTRSMRLGPDAAAQLRRYIASAMADAPEPAQGACSQTPQVVVELRGAGRRQRGRFDGCRQPKALASLWDVTRAVVRRFPGCGIGRTAPEFPQLAQCGGFPDRATPR